MESASAAMDVFALTSHNEANPISILEAMSVGLPVVATDVGGIPEIVRPGETGVLVPGIKAMFWTLFPHHQSKRYNDNMRN